MPVLSRALFWLAILLVHYLWDTRVLGWLSVYWPLQYPVQVYFTAIFMLNHYLSLILGNVYLDFRQSLAYHIHSNDETMPININNVHNCSMSISYLWNTQTNKQNHKQKVYCKTPTSYTFFTCTMIQNCKFLHYQHVRKHTLKKKKKLNPHAVKHYPPSFVIKQVRSGERCMQFHQILFFFFKRQTPKYKLTKDNQRLLRRGWTYRPFWLRRSGKLVSWSASLLRLMNISDSTVTSQSE